MQAFCLLVAVFYCRFRLIFGQKSPKLQRSEQGWENKFTRKKSLTYF
jgi:hypothetical protein